MKFQTFLLPVCINEAIFPVIPTINDSHSFGFGIEEHKEAMTQKIHLENCFLRRHGADIEMFGLYNFKFCIRSRGRFLLHDELMAQGISFFKPFCQTSFILMNLPFYLIKHQINRLVHIIGLFDTPENNAVNDTCLRPKYAVLDPELTVGLPPHITSTTGMDALTHAVEAYIGKSNTKETIAEAEEAVKLIFANLEKAYTDGKDLEARGNMLKGSYLAGRAFTHAYVGYVHAIAHNLGGLYGTPHGLANAVILPYVLDYYGDCIYPQLAKLADIAGVSAPGMSTADKGKAFIAAIRQMNENMNIPSTFDMIKEEDIPLLVQRALKEGNPLYPVPKIMDAKDCEAVIRSFMA